VRCMVGRCVFSSRRVSITAGIRGGSGSHVISMDVAEMNYVFHRNKASTGSLLVTVHGAGLLSLAYTLMARVGFTGCELTEWNSETSLIAIVGHSVRSTRGVSLTVGHNVASISHMMSFDAGSISGIYITNRAGTGSAFVIIHGAGLGLDSYTALIRAGQTACEGTEWESETSCGACSAMVLVGLGKWY